MPKRIAIASHLSLEELELRYRQAKEPIERSHYQIIWLLASGRHTEHVAEITGYSRNWIYELVWGYNRVGSETLGDGRVDNPGAAPLLDDMQQANLWQALKGSAPDGGLWNGRKVAGKRNKRVLWHCLYGKLSFRLGKESDGWADDTRITNRYP